MTSYWSGGTAECNISWPDSIEAGANIVMQRNLVADPLLCNPLEGDLHISYESPCSPPNNPFQCERIGALEEGCHVTPTLNVTWGRIKNMFREAR